MDKRNKLTQKYKYITVMKVNEWSQQTNLKRSKKTKRTEEGTGFDQLMNKVGVILQVRTCNNSIKMTAADKTNENLKKEKKGNAYTMESSISRVSKQAG